MALAATFRTEASEAMLEGYWIGLEDIPFSAVQSSVVQAMRASKFMPNVAELREFAGDRKVSLADRAQVAWGVFERAVVQHGAYRSVSFDDPIVNATVRSLGGWQRCCDLPVTEFDTFLRQSFLKAYEAFARTGASDDLSAPLLGIHDQHNGLHGYGTKKPVMIATGLPPLARLEKQQREQQAIAADVLSLTHDIGAMQ